jgi:eukaryotic-like serine/threonine-protein kinase
VTTLHEALRARRGPWTFQESVGAARAIARALAACEEASLFPGPLTPEAIVIEGGVARVPAAELALADAKEGAARTAETASPLWMPPAQADGAPWDAAANRYTLGLVLYRLLAGEHPFTGAGLRHAMEAAHRAPPPFKESVASGLPAGLQSLTLRMLDPDPAQRPGSARAIEEELAAFVAAGALPPNPRPLPPAAGGRGAGGSRATFPARPSSSSAPAPLPPQMGGKGLGVRGQRPGGQRRYWPVLAGAAIALASVAVLAKAPSAPPPTLASAPLVPPTAPLTAPRTAASDCAACHPRQAAEWRRSVMAHAVKSPLFNALESLIEEQVGRDEACPNGAGILRRASLATACRDTASNLPVTGSGGEHWCVNCHSPVEKLDTRIPPWEGRAGGDARSRLPVRDLLGERAMEGISCGFCHEVHGPVPARGAARGGYEGNAAWTSFVTGATFAARPEDARGLTGIGNSGYDLRPQDFLAVGGGATGEVLGGAHLRAPRSTAAYLRSSELCGSCHDVRLFGTDTIGAGRGEHFKRLRNAYSEWAAWAAGETRAGRTPASCQDCHMSAYPGVCEADPGGAGDGGCPQGYRFAPRAPGTLPKGRSATTSAALAGVTTHYFSGVDVPLSREYPDELVDEPTVDLSGIPLSARGRRDMLLRRAFRFGLGAARAVGQRLEIPVEIENVGAGHRVPAGFSQEREIWVHLVVRDARGGVVYEVGRVGRGDEDLYDKVFTRVNVRGDDRDGKGRPVGLFGADVRDGPDVPAWQPPPLLGGASFRGRGLVNFQNGFLRCVRCLGTVGEGGRCEAGPGQGDDRAARFADGDYDLDTGACRSNLSGMNALFETYFPVGALDASRGLAKGPDAIVDTRSAPPGVPLRYTYDLDAGGRRGPFKVEAHLLFRAFPPFLVKGFAAYEREQARRGLRPGGPLVTEEMLGRLEVVELARAEAEVR